MNFRSLILMSMTVGMAMATMAMPSKTALEKSQRMVKELMQEDLAALNAKKKTASEVGRKAVRYAMESKSEADKYLFFRGAVYLYARGGDEKRALKTLKMMQEAIDGMSQVVVVNLLSPLIRELSEEQVPVLHAICRGVQNKKAALKALAEAEARADKYPNDKVCRRMLADLRAAVGDWKRARKDYVKCGGPEAKAMADEQNGNKLAAGDYWWNYVPTNEDQASVFKLYAVSLYRSGLADGSIDALAKVVVEKRLSQMKAMERAIEFLNRQLATAPGERKILTGKTVTLPGGAKLELVWCPPCPNGYLMGNPGGSNDRQHLVKLSRGFWIGKYEVTQDQWGSVMGGNPSRRKGGDRPVDSVAWAHCQEFCKKAGLGLRLPTEAEWEYACRAGTKGDYAGELPEMGWFNRNSSGTSHSVGSKEPNDWGIYDMHGNVWEWCQDWHGDYPEGEAVDPKGPESGKDRVVRGGCWGTGWWGCRSFGHGNASPTDTSCIRGFRVVCFDDPAESQSKK